MVPALLRAAADGSFLGVDWGAFVVVSLVALAATVVIVVCYALGLRLLAAGAPLDEPDGSPAGGPAVRRPAIATGGAVVCFAIGVAAVLYGIWLIVPQFH